MIFKVNDVVDWTQILDVWACKVGIFLDVYLGLPLGSKHKTLSVWEPLIDKVRKRLALWKRRYLAKGGRLVLIKATLQNLLVFMLSSRFLPISVAYEVEKIMRKFLWGTTDGLRKFHLVAFEGVCLPFELGGLRMKQLIETNISLLCKWFWRLKENVLWVNLLKEKYGVVVAGFFPQKLVKSL